MNSSPTRELAVYPAILERNYNQVLSLQSYYLRITIIRVDLNTSENHNNDHKLVKLLQRLRFNLGFATTYQMSLVHDGGFQRPLLRHEPQPDGHTHRSGAIPV